MYVLRSDNFSTPSALSNCLREIANDIPRSPVDQKALTRDLFSLAQEVKSYSLAVGGKSFSDINLLTSNHGSIDRDALSKFVDDLSDAVKGLSPIIVSQISRSLFPQGGAVAGMQQGLRAATHQEPLQKFEDLFNKNYSVDYFERVLREPLRTAFQDLNSTGESPMSVLNINVFIHNGHWNIIVFEGLERLIHNRICFGVKFKNGQIEISNFHDMNIVMQRSSVRRSPQALKADYYSSREFQTDRYNDQMGIMSHDMAAALHRLLPSYKDLIAKTRRF